MDRSYQLSLFADHLPRRVACTDDLSHGTTWQSRADALECAYLAPNPKHLLWSMMFDVDRPGAALEWDTGTLPAPNWTAENPTNRHAHLGYILEAPVSRSPISLDKPQRFLARIEAGLTVALDADRCYTHRLTKTPEHPRWSTSWPRQAPYQLDELRDYLGVDLPLRIRREEAVGIGRNVSMFDGLRRWAYRARLNFESFDAWYSACLVRAESINNQFPATLPFSEVKATARSVAKWTWAHISAAGLSEVQRRRVNKRWAQNIDTLSLMLEINR